jgi:predicted transcriptional regulator
MKKHNGMRKQDIVILLKILTYGKKQWYGKDLGISLHISMSEVSESLNRSAIAGLLNESKNEVMHGNLLEFLEHGLKYIYPITPGGIQRGIPTAHSALPLRNKISSEEMYVWPDPAGEVRGESIEPLYPTVAEAIKSDKLLYELLALTDALRIAKVREREIAIEEIKKRITV